MINLCVFGVPPALVYKGSKGEGLAGQAWRARRVLLPLGVGSPPPNPSWTRILQGEERERGPATSPSPNRTRGRGGGAQPMRAALSPLHQGPCWPIMLLGGSGNPPGIPVKS